MITGKLVKFEPCQSDITVMIKVPKSQMHSVVDLYDRDVTISDELPDLSADTLLKTIHLGLDRLMTTIEGIEGKEGLL